MGGGLARQVVHLADADLSNAISATKVKALRDSENLMVGHYLTYKSQKTGKIKQVFLAPYMSGGDMEGKTFNAKVIASSSLQIGRGLKTMHNNGWVHRDIKPANILMDSAGRVRLMDFDFATNLTKVSENTLVKFGGSVGYISPELMNDNCRGAKGAYENDIFGLGVTLLENCGFNLWTQFTERPEIQDLIRKEKYEAVSSAFSEYMRDFDVNSIRDESRELMEKNPETKELGDLYHLAIDMMGPAETRPNIDQVVFKLEQINQKTNEFTAT